MSKKCTERVNTNLKSPRTLKRFNAVAVTLEKKQQCNSKALQIVTDFSEETVSEDNLTKSLEFINQEHYQDITEERAISKLCGYPLCSRKLKNIPTKQYHISTTHNKVFDITDRKNFCSNLCYKASKYLKDQISTSPLWLREKHPSKNYKLISLQSNGGIVGDEVDLGHTPIKWDSCEIVTSPNAGCEAKIDQNSKSPLQQEQLSSHYHVSNVPTEGCIGNKDDHKMEKVDISLPFDPKGESLSKIIPELTCVNDPCNEFSSKPIQTSKAVFSDENQKISEVFDHKSDIEETYFNTNNSSLNKRSNNTKSIRKDVNSKATTEKDSNVPSSLLVNSENQKGSSKRKTDSKKKQIDVSAMKNVVIKIEQVLKEWFSIDSLCLIFGKDKVKEMLVEKKKYIGSISIDTHFYERYLAICRKLNILELEDTKVDASFKEEAKKPLPDYESLKEEAKTLDLKVKMFYKGDKLVQFEERQPDSVNSENCIEAPVLPLVDLHAQKALRRRIVFDKLRRVLQDLQKSLGLRCFNLNEDVQTLISTFTLSAHNITMKPAEWNFIAIILIKLLSLNNKNLEQVLKSNSTDKHLTLLLMSYSLDAAYLDRLVVWLTDIESLMEKNY